MSSIHKIKITVKFFLFFVNLFQNKYFSKPSNVDTTEFLFVYKGVKFVYIEPDKDVILLV